MADPIILMENPYAGVNPHLNSGLQTPGIERGGVSLWPSFHSDHITNISEFLNDQLPQNYIARTEQSLQIRLEDYTRTASGRVSHPEPDVTIYGHPSVSTLLKESVVATASPTFEAALEETLDLTENFVGSVIIREVDADEIFGQVVVRIELLSPSNKREQVGYESYRRGKNNALFSGTPLIEIDYLHESLPTVMTYPEYPRQRDSHPYNIFVSEPRPSVDKGYVLAYGFGVDAPFPKVPIPLANDESLEFDFGAVYQYTFKRGRWGKMANYAELPIRFETYSLRDQARIRARMMAIQENIPR